MNLRNKLPFFSILICVSVYTSAATIVVDGFSNSTYTDGDVLQGQNPAVTGFSGAWTGPASNLRRIESATTGIAGFFNNKTDGGLIGDPSFTSNQNFARTVDAGANNPAQTPDGTSLWMAFSANMSTITQGFSVGYDLSGTNGGSSTPFIILDNSTFAIAANAAGSNPIVSDSLTTDLNGEDILVVYQLEVLDGGSGQNERVSAWLFNSTDFAAWDRSQGNLSSSATIALAPTEDNIFAVASGYSVGEARISSLGITSGTQIDEYRLSTDFDGLNIIAIPEPSSLALIAIAVSAIVMVRRRM